MALFPKTTLSHLNEQIIEERNMTRLKQNNDNNNNKNMPHNISNNNKRRLRRESNPRYIRSWHVCSQLHHESFQYMTR